MLEGEAAVDGEFRTARSGPRRDSVRRRVAWAGVAFLAGWVASGAVWVLFTRPWVPTPTLGPGWSDAMAILLFEAGFAAIGWFLVVLPLVRFGDHDGWLFRPRLAPLIGAVCGVAILLAEFWAFFGLPPWESLAGTGDDGVRLLAGLAAVFGGVLWSTYTWATRSDA